MEYWRCGGHPKYGGDGYVIFRDKIKRDLGAGFESWVYADIIDGQPRIYKTDSFDDIPERIRTDKYKAEIIRGKLKSWSDYTKRERQKTIDNLLDDIRANGCNTAKMEKIIIGMMEDK